MAKSGKIYRIQIAGGAADFIRKQTKKNQRQIMNKISSLTENPHNRGDAIKSKPEFFNIRSANFRIAYTVKERQILVFVVRVRHRKDFYRYFER